MSLLFNGLISNLDLSNECIASTSIFAISSGLRLASAWAIASINSEYSLSVYGTLARFVAKVYKVFYVADAFFYIRP